MDRVRMHVQRVRCLTCSRVFCCVNHRFEHEHNVHTTGGSIAVTVPVIKRRFRLTAGGQRGGERRTAVGVPNGRKRLRTVVVTAAGYSVGSCLPEKLRHHHHPYQWPKDTPLRIILKAHRAALLPSVDSLHPVAESSSAEPTPRPPSSTPRPSPSSTPRPPTSTPQPPSPGATSAPGAPATPFQSPEVDNSEGSDVDSPTSFYQTPKHTFSGSPVSPGSSGPADVNVNTSPVRVAESSTIGSRTSTVRRSALGKNLKQKGFFWTNVARRFRLALRPGKSREGSSSPEVTGVKQYDNILSRRPIRDAVATPVFARPSLDTIRLQVHEETRKVLFDSTNSSENTDNDQNTHL